MQFACSGWESRGHAYLVALFPAKNTLNMLRPAWTGRFRTPARKPSIYAPSNANGPQTPFLLGLQAIEYKGN